MLKLWPVFSICNRREMVLGHFYLGDYRIGALIRKNVSNPQAKIVSFAFLEIGFVFFFHHSNGGMSYCKLSTI
jgi:hypothetical protein